MERENELKSKRNLEKDAGEIAYYERISAGFGRTQVVIYLLLLFFVVSAFLLNTKLITYRNFYYLVKDLNASAETMGVLHSDSLSYPAEENQSFALYRNGLAVAGDSTVTIFTAAGKQSVQKNISYENPTAVGGGKYLLIYDMGGTDYSLYNSYSQVHSEKAPSAIRDCAISENGFFVICSGGSETISEVTVFNKYFEKAYLYSFDSYVTDIAISKDGSSLAMLTTSADKGLLQSVLHVYRTGDTNPSFQTIIGSSIGLSCEFTEAGCVSVLCQNNFKVFSPEGTTLADFDFGEKQLQSISMTADGCALLLKENQISQKKFAIVFDKSGKVLYNEEVKKPAQEVVLHKNSIFFKFTDGICRIRLSDSATAFLSCDTSGVAILATEESGVFLCSRQKSVYYRLNL